MADLLFPLLDVSKAGVPERVYPGGPSLLTGGGSLTTDGFAAPVRDARVG